MCVLLKKGLCVGVRAFGRACVGGVRWRACVCMFAHVTNRWMLDAIGLPELLHYGCVLVNLFTCFLM